MTILIYVDLQNIKTHEKKILKYLFYKLPYIMILNKKEVVSLYFKNNNRFFKNVHIKNIYYYLMRNTFVSVNNNIHTEIIENNIENTILINNYKNKYCNEILNKSKNIVLLNLKTPSIELSINIIFRFNDLYYNNINCFEKYSFEKKDFSLDNFIDSYPFLDCINDEKVIQHYNKYLSEKIENDSNIFIDKITKRNIIKNKNNKIEKNIKLINLLENDESMEFFISSVSMSTYMDEINNGSFMGIMINTIKDISKIIFIPNLVETNFGSDIISYTDFLDLQKSKIEELEGYNICKIKNSEINLTKININNQNINGIIPLYINSNHFKIIYKNLEKYIGVVFTGNEMGYNIKLIRVFYKILSDYIYFIYNLKKNNKLNDKEIILFLNYFRFCCEISKYMGYHKGIKKYFESLNDIYKESSIAIEFLISQVFTTGNIQLLNDVILVYRKTNDKTENFNITILILENLIKHFGSWTKFLDIFDTNNGFFDDVSFIKNIDI